MTNLNFQNLRTAIQNFEFKKLFLELGWNNPTTEQNTPLIINDQIIYYQQLAQLGVVILQVTVNTIPDAKTRLAVHEKIGAIYHEHVLIFVNQDKTQSYWSWLKRDNKKYQLRSHSYFKGQTGDLLLSKIIAMGFDFDDFNDDGEVNITEVTSRLRKALDIEPITKKFFKDFEIEHSDFVDQILGIENEKKRAWYASVLLHRLMFIWFLQKKMFLDNGNGHYLSDKLSIIQNTRGENQYYREFLIPLFFEGFAKPEQERSKAVNELLGKICYLNGGLFLPHSIEEHYKDKIQVNDKAFSDLFALFNKYSWNLNDTLDGADNEINPDVLGYIFEKYINQKAFGAYYTRSEITDYLCERTICQLILDNVNQPAIPELNVAAGRHYKDLPELLFKCDAQLYYQLLTDILPSISLLDPACGSGAFLVAAMKTLTNIYYALIGKIQFLNHPPLTQWLADIEKDHPNIDYFIKKQIIKNNLYGVDIMPEATEIAKLRLFLALVSSAQKVEHLEPLPNIDFNIMAGNSLIGLLSVEGEKFNQLGQTGDIFRDNEAQSYQSILAEKNALIASYKDVGTYSKDLTALRDTISMNRARHYKKLNRLLLNEFERLKIQYEQASWDESKNKAGKVIKRALTLVDMAVLQPFHWGYEFDTIFARGGFDAIITNPPWEVFKPQAKEFFADYSELVTKNKMTIKDFEKEQDKLLANIETRAAWLEYQSRFPFVSLYFRSSADYTHQTAVVNGKKTGSDINLYKLFTERSFALLKNKGECGIVIPSGIYTDLGATGLRKLLFNETRLTGLFCFENNKLIFEGVHRSFKFVVLTFAKLNLRGLKDLPGFQSFPVAFMRHEVSELNHFPDNDSLIINTDLIKKLSPDSWSIMEFKNDRDIAIAEKMLKFPLLGEMLENTWNLKLSNEFHMTNDSYLFKTACAKGRLPLYEGKMIHQFSHAWGQPKYWLDETEARKALLSKQEDIGQVLDYQGYRLAFRDVAASTNERTMIATILPPNVFTGNTLVTSILPKNNLELLVITALLNSFVADALIRQKVTAHCNMFYVYQLPIPRLTESDPTFKAIVERAAALICTTPDFDDLKKVCGSTNQGLNSDRQQTRAELDAIIAHLYGLSEDEFAHILNTFPIVKPEVKAAALAAFQSI